MSRLAVLGLVLLLSMASAAPQQKKGAPKKHTPAVAQKQGAKHTHHTTGAHHKPVHQDFTCTDCHDCQKVLKKFASHRCKGQTGEAAQQCRSAMAAFVHAKMATLRKECSHHKPHKKIITHHHHHHHHASKIHHIHHTAKHIARKATHKARHVLQKVKKTAKALKKSMHALHNCHHKKSCKEAAKQVRQTRKNLVKANHKAKKFCGKRPKAVLDAVHTLNKLCEKAKGAHATHCHALKHHMKHVLNKFSRHTCKVVRSHVPHVDPKPKTKARKTRVLRRKLRRRKRHRWHHVVKARKARHKKRSVKRLQRKLKKLGGVHHHKQRAKARLLRREARATFLKVRRLKSQPHTKQERLQLAGRLAKLHHKLKQVLRPKLAPSPFAPIKLCLVEVRDPSDNGWGCNSYVTVHPPRQTNPTHKRVKKCVTYAQANQQTTCIKHRVFRVKRTAAEKKAHHAHNLANFLHKIHTVMMQHINRQRRQNARRVARHLQHKFRKSRRKLRKLHGRRIVTGRYEHHQKMKQVHAVIRAHKKAERAVRRHTRALERKHPHKAAFHIKARQQLLRKERRLEKKGHMNLAHNRHKKKHVRHALKQAKKHAKHQKKGSKAHARAKRRVKHLKHKLTHLRQKHKKILAKHGLAHSHSGVCKKCKASKKAAHTASKKLIHQVFKHYHHVHRHHHYHKHANKQSNKKGFFLFL